MVVLKSEGGFVKHAGCVRGISFKDKHGPQIAVWGHVGVICLVVGEVCEALLFNAGGRVKYEGLNIQI